ncbi:hypothetical protein J6590_049113 [Homalodisca vitripennis]|nr:hypothetical protein J6590_049113 [Homalodisca vitripennis]
MGKELIQEKVMIQPSHVSDALSEWVWEQPRLCQTSPSAEHRNYTTYLHVHLFFSMVFMEENPVKTSFEGTAGLS